MSGEDREQLRGFVAASRRRLQDLLERLGWNERATSSNHIPEEKPEMLEELPLPASCCTNPAFSLQLDDATLQQITGTNVASGIQSFEDLQVALSEQHRLLIYEHVLQHTAKHPEFQDNAAFAQLVGETKRERKNQRRHRKTKPTLNEELHQLVGLQMEALQRQWQKEKEHKEHRERHRHTGSSRKWRSKSRSPEKHRHGHRRREERHTKHHPYKSDH